MIIDAKVKQKDLMNGIGIIDYCRTHEKYIDAQIESGVNLTELLDWHSRKLTWMQHERLVHFEVTILTGIFFLFAFGAWIALALADAPDFACTLAIILSIALLLLLAAYLWHYFKLENTVQHWYRIAEELHDRIGNNG